MKNSFILYNSYATHIKLLTSEQKGKLLDLIFGFADNPDIISDDQVVNMAFSFIREDMKENSQKWDEIKQKRSAAGKMGGRPPGEEKAKKANAFPDKQTETKKAVDVNVDVYVNDNVNKKNKQKEIDSIYAYWNEKTKQNLKGDKEIIKNLNSILKDYSVDNIKSVIDFICTNKWYQENGQILLSVICKPTKFADKLDRALNSKPKDDGIFRCNSNDFSEVF